MTFPTPDFLSRTRALIAVAARSADTVNVDGYMWDPQLAERAQQACLSRFRNGVNSLCRIRINPVGRPDRVQMTDHGKRVAARAARMFNLGA